jgi:antitoxin (DNA-binding transcriptional repressor) of toxin-antitoxin stability system
MRFVTVKDLSTKPRQIWEMIADDDVVLTSNGKPMAIISGVTEDRLEKTLSIIRRSRFMAALEEMQEHALETGLHRMTDSGIDKVIAETRKARRK